jgi:hypothetical protein
MTIYIPFWLFFVICWAACGIPAYVLARAVAREGGGPWTAGMRLGAILGLPFLGVVGLIVFLITALQEGAITFPAWMDKEAKW